VSGLTVPADRLAVVPLRGVCWNGLGRAERALGTVPTRVTPMREPIPTPMSA
jgi:hypothetical protein